MTPLTNDAPSQLSELAETPRAGGLAYALRERGVSIKVLGWRKGVKYLREKWRSKRALHSKTKNAGPYSEFVFDAPGLKFPVTGRSGTSDVLVYEQMFLVNEYSCLPDIGSVKTIVDCGANVGFASAYLLSRFPDAQIISIEPDGGNFAMLQKNTAPYGGRAHLVQAGVWSQSADLVIRREAFGGAEWGFTVEECPPGQTPDVKAVGLGELMTQYQLDTIDILKVDIEGSEKVVFGANTENWINKVRVLVLELHGPDCERIVQNAVAHRKHTVSRFHELTVYHFADNEQ